MKKKDWTALHRYFDILVEWAYGRTLSAITIFNNVFSALLTMLVFSESSEFYIKSSNGGLCYKHQ